jgi:hypothetical protein
VPVIVSTCCFSWPVKVHIAAIFNNSVIIKRRFTAMLIVP